MFDPTDKFSTWKQNDTSWILKFGCKCISYLTTTHTTTKILYDTNNFHFLWFCISAKATNANNSTNNFRLRACKTELASLNTKPRIELREKKISGVFYMKRKEKMIVCRGDGSLGLGAWSLKILNEKKNGRGSKYLAAWKNMDDDL